MQSFINQIKSFLGFHKRQERGAFVLVVLIVFAFGIDFFLPVILKEETYDFTSALAEIEAWKATLEERKLLTSNDTETSRSTKYKSKTIKLNPIIFNPNNLPEEKWLAMGMPKYVVSNLLKYESKGGHFKKKEDLKKIYGFTPQLYNQLKDFISIPENKVETSAKPYLKSSTIEKVLPSKSNIRLDINRVDSIALLEVPGIGPFYAGVIVKYRKRLGGFNSLNQLGEMYKMDSARLRTILPYLFMNDTILRQIDLNVADFKTVLKHPYIDYETAKRIMNRRNKLGRYAGLYQLKNDSILSDSLFQKLEPYIKLD